MAIPSSVTQLLVVLVLVVPGFVYQAVRIRIVGRKPGDSDLPTRILRAIVISTVFALVYVVALAPDINTAAQAQVELADHPRRSALIGLLAGFIFPTISAMLLNSDRIALPNGFLRHPIRTIRDEEWTRYDPRPSSWDVAFEGASVGFVRVRMADGTWVAGYYGPNSYASSHPDPRNLFLELAYEIDASGKIGEPITNSAGLVIDCANALVVELLDVEEVDGNASKGTFASTGLVLLALALGAIRQNRGNSQEALDG